MDINQFIQNFKEDAFASSAAFQKHVVYTPLNCQPLKDSEALRALCVFMHFQMVNAPSKCLKCGGKCKLIQGRSPDELMWVCQEATGTKHFRHRFQVPALPELRVNNLLAFLHFLVFMRCNERIKRIIQELRDAHNTSKASIARWQKLYHTALTAFVESKNINKIGGRSERCAVDETAVGKVGKMVGKNGTAQGAFQRNPVRIRARRPCKTLWKPGAKSFPKPMKAGSSKDKRSNKATQWVWLGVQTGKDGQAPRTHASGTKRVAMEVPPSASQAPGKKPCGAEVLEKVLSTRLRSRTKLTADGWKATEKAASALQIPLKTCNHKKEYRAKDGSHTNDAESEVARFKKWARSKWTQVRSLNVKDVDAKQEHLRSKINEYVLATNRSSVNGHISMKDVLAAFRCQNDTTLYKPVRL